MIKPITSSDLLPSERLVMSINEVQDRLKRIAGAFTAANIPFAIIGGQAVALWVTSINKKAERFTKDVDLLLRREDLEAAKVAAETVGLEYCRSYGVDMFVEKVDPSAVDAVHIIWADEVVREKETVPAPSVTEIYWIQPQYPVLTLAALIRMKLTSRRRHDLVHVCDMIRVGLIDASLSEHLPEEFRELFLSLVEEVAQEPPFPH